MNGLTDAVCPALAKPSRIRSALVRTCGSASHVRHEQHALHARASVSPFEMLTCDWFRCALLPNEQWNPVGRAERGRSSGPRSASGRSQSKSSQLGFTALPNACELELGSKPG